MVQCQLKMNIHVYTTIPIEHTSGRFCVLVIKTLNKIILSEYLKPAMSVIEKHQVAKIKQGTFFYINIHQREINSISHTI